MQILTQLPDKPSVPPATRPRTQKEYGIPDNQAGLLSWEYVCQRMAEAQTYWVATVRPDGRPHAVPTWGIWYNEMLYFGGGAETHWSRNLTANPQVAVHLEDGAEAVIFEGLVARITDAAVMAPIDDAYLAKYEMRHGPPVWVLQPRVVLAWTEYPLTATRWRFA
ncbi:MAG TPA: pyridoxamine 5'-phosphate oxidase [Anaerolineae bacterium]|nr:pyridoxamine 5'-phosphate oxidase [Anaerolineae bacterium]